MAGHSTLDASIVVRVHVPQLTSPRKGTVDLKTGSGKDLHLTVHIFRHRSVNSGVKESMRARDSFWSRINCMAHLNNGLALIQSANLPPSKCSNKASLTLSTVAILSNSSMAVGCPFSSDPQKNTCGFMAIARSFAARFNLSQSG